MEIKASLTPSYDNKIYQKYSKSTLNNKVENKLAFQEELGLIVDKKIPLLCITTNLTDKKGGKLLEEVFDGLMELDIQIIIIGVGTEKYQKLISQYEEKYKHMIKIISDNEDNKRKIYAASDIGIVLTEDKEDIDSILNYLSYGVIPVVSEKMAKELPVSKYNPVEENGNAFIYKKNKWLFFAAIIKAIENFIFPYDWSVIQKNAMESITIK